VGPIPHESNVTNYVTNLYKNELIPENTITFWYNTNETTTSEVVLGGMPQTTCNRSEFYTTEQSKGKIPKKNCWTVDMKDIAFDYRDGNMTSIGVNGG